MPSAISTGELERRFISEIDKLFMARVGCTWADLCGDREPIVAALEQDKTPLEFVDWYIVKYDLQEIV